MPWPGHLHRQTLPRHLAGSGSWVHSGRPLSRFLGSLLLDLCQKLLGGRPASAVPRVLTVPLNPLFLGGPARHLVLLVPLPVHRPSSALPPNSFPNHRHNNPKRRYPGLDSEQQTGVGRRMILNNLLEVGLEPWETVAPTDGPAIPPCRKLPTPGAQ